MSGRALQIGLALLLAGLWGALLGTAHLRGELPILGRVEAALTDIRTQLRGKKVSPGLVTIVAIDDESVRQFGGFPLPRAALARIVEAIGRQEPSVVAVDILLVDKGSEDGDGKLESALGGVNGVIAAAAVFENASQSTSGAGPLAGIPVAERLLLPQARFIGKAPLGVVNVSTDRSGAPRFFPMLFRTQDALEASMPLRAAAAAMNADPEIESGRLILAGRTIPTDIGQTLPLSFYGPRGTIRTVSAADVVGGTVPADAILGRAVVIGATVTGGGDVFPTAFDPVLPGVEVIATALSHLLAGDGLVRDATVRRLDAAVVIALPVMLVALLAWRRNAIGLASAAALLVAWGLLNFAAFENGYWLSAAVPMAAAAPPVLLFGATQLWQGRRAAHHFASQSEMLQRVQGAGLSQWLAHNPDFLSEPVRQDAAIVFVDLSGYTGLSEALGPVATRELLASFYDLVDEEVTACGGALTSFMGDGAMLLFGLPVPSAADPLNAATCCVRLSRRLSAWLDERSEKRIGFKIGAHCGPVVASRLGSGATQQIATTGDTVNVASRLMGFAARNGADVALSGDLVAAAGFEILRPGTLSGPREAHLRGRTETVAVWLWSVAS